MKRCTKCKITKKITDFGYRSDTQDKLRTQCKECENEYKRSIRKKINTYNINKICKENGCNTILSIYNKNNRCWVHQREFLMQGAALIE